MPEFEFKYKTYNHAKTHLRYHVIFSTKYRRKVLDPIREEVFKAFRYAESISHFRILEMNLDQDHIHLMITFRPSFSLASIIKRMKSIITIHLYQNELVKLYLKKFFQKKDIIWAKGYFCSTIGHSSEEIISNYIKNQGKH